MRKFIYLIIGILSIGICSSYLTNQNKIRAFNFIESYYSHHDHAVYYAKIQGNHIDYKVTFDNGTIIKYDDNYYINFIECGKYDTIPREVLSKKVQKYIVQNYDSVKIIKYMILDKSMEIVLNNGDSIKFKYGRD